MAKRNLISGKCHFGSYVNTFTCLKRSAPYVADYKIRTGCMINIKACFLLIFLFITEKFKYDNFRNIFFFLGFFPSFS